MLQKNESGGKMDGEEDGERRDEKQQEAATRSSRSIISPKCNESMTNNERTGLGFNLYSML